MERARRTWLFCAALILNNAILVPEFLGGSFARCHLVYRGSGHFTAIQRIMRARRLLVDAPKSDI
jgi:hypothetical protein